MSLTYERPSTTSPNGRSANAPTCEFGTRAERRGGRNGSYSGSYSGDEIAARTSVPRDLVGDAAYAAIDVVRFAVVERLMRSGVPVARAIALVRAAENGAPAAI